LSWITFNRHQIERDPPQKQHKHPPEITMPAKSAPPAPLRLGIAGLGTVGIGVVKIVQRHADLIAARTGRAVIITAVCARDRTRK
jgi:hypothetical protein